MMRPTIAVLTIVFALGWSGGAQARNPAPLAQLPDTGEITAAQALALFGRSADMRRGGAHQLVDFAGAAVPMGALEPLHGWIDAPARATLPPFAAFGPLFERLAPEWRAAAADLLVVAMVSTLRDFDGDLGRNAEASRLLLRALVDAFVAAPAPTDDGLWREVASTYRRWLDVGDQELGALRVDWIVTLRVLAAWTVLHDPGAASVLLGRDVGPEVAATVQDAEAARVFLPLARLARRVDGPLRDAVSDLYTRYAITLASDPWAALEGGWDVVEGASPELLGRATLAWLTLASERSGAHLAAVLERIARDGTLFRPDQPALLTWQFYSAMSATGLAPAAFGHDRAARFLDGALTGARQLAERRGLQLTGVRPGLEALVLLARDCEVYVTPTLMQALASELAVSGDVFEALASVAESSRGCFLGTESSGPVSLAEVRAPVAQPRERHLALTDATSWLIIAARAARRELGDRGGDVPELDGLARSLIQAWTVHRFGELRNALVDIAACSGVQNAHDLVGCWIDGECGAEAVEVVIHHPYHAVRLSGTAAIEMASAFPRPCANADGRRSSAGSSGCASYAVPRGSRHVRIATPVRTAVTLDDGPLQRGVRCSVGGETGRIDCNVPIRGEVRDITQVDSPR